MSILALHGFTGCGADFAPFAKLCGGEWHCPDLPGHGSNSQLDCSPAGMVQFIDQTRATLHAPHSTSKKILLGYSLGARAALLHATHNPDIWDALILISANPGIEDEITRVKRRASDADLADSIERAGVAAFLEFWQQMPLIRSQQNIPIEWRKIMQTKRLQHQPDGLANSLRQFGQGSCPNLWPELPKLKLPGCLITGALDNKYTSISERMRVILNRTRAVNSTSSQSKIRKVHHQIIEDAAHMPQLEQAKCTSAVIKSFLSSFA